MSWAEAVYRIFHEGWGYVLTFAIVLGSIWLLGSS